MTSLTSHFIIQAANSQVDKRSSQLLWEDGVMKAASRGSGTGWQLQLLYVHLKCTNIKGKQRWIKKKKP